MIDCGFRPLDSAGEAATREMFAGSGADSTSISGFFAAARSRFADAQPATNASAMASAALQIDAVENAFTTEIRG
jgi:hypothetical protein